jgi:hypothetical protein
VSLAEQHGGEYRDGAATCITGVNLPGFDLPNMPIKGVTKELCQSYCAGNSSCQAYVFTPKGCDNSPTR